MEALGKKPHASIIITTNGGLDQLCQTVNSTVECRRLFWKKCATGLQADTFDFFQEQFTESVKQFCNSPPTRKTFLQHSPCIDEKVLTQKPYHTKCVNDLLAALDKGQRMANKTLDEAEDSGFDVSFTKQSLADRILDLTCCSYNRFQRCSMDLIVKECGQPAKDAMTKFTRSTFGANINRMCPKKMFNPTKSMCRTAMPPPGSDPKAGDLKKNPLGKYMMTYMGFILNYSDPA